MRRKILVFGIILLLVGLAFSPTIYADNKMSLDPVPDLDCSGELDWLDVVPGATVEGLIIVENIGEPNSLLDWEIVSFPDWGTWTFYPDSGTGLTPEFGEYEVNVEVVFPDPPEEEQWSEIIIVNLDNPDDVCILDVYYHGKPVPVLKSIKQTFKSIVSTYCNVGNTIFDPIPDLDCAGELDLSESEPGETIQGTIGIENIGEPESLLNWELESYPEWGTWTFDPVCGYNLTPEYGVYEVDIVVVLPDELEDEIDDAIKFVNLDDSEDYCCIDVYRKDAIDYNDYTPIQLVFLLINKLRYYEGIESEEDVLEIIENDAELSGIVDELKSFDCGCEDDTTEWGYPIICTILTPIFFISIFVYVLTYGKYGWDIFIFISALDDELHCPLIDW